MDNNLSFKAPKNCSLIITAEVFITYFILSGSEVLTDMFYYPRLKNILDIQIFNVVTHFLLWKKCFSRSLLFENLIVLIKFVRKM